VLVKGPSTMTECCSQLIIFYCLLSTRRRKDFHTRRSTYLIISHDTIVLNQDVRDWRMDQDRWRNAAHIYLFSISRCHPDAGRISEPYKVGVLAYIFSNNIHNQGDILT